MNPEQLAALVASVPGIAALMWVVLRQQQQLDRLIESLLLTQQTLLKLHPPQTAEAAKKLTETGS